MYLVDQLYLILTTNQQFFEQAWFSTKTARWDYYVYSRCSWVISKYITWGGSFYALQKNGKSKGKIWLNGVSLLNTQFRSKHDHLKSRIYFP